MYLEGLLAALTFSAAALLVAAGIVKLRRPQPTADALAGVGLPGRRTAVRTLGIVEVAVGAGAFLWPAELAPALALLYVGSALFVGYVLLKGLPLTSCGCLGETDTEPSPAHFGVTAMAAVAGAAAAIASPPAVPYLLAHTPVAGAFFLATVAVASYLAYLTLVFLPEAFAAYRQPVRSD